MSYSKKIICTLGPSSLNPRVIRRLDELKVDIFRLNLSHTPLDRLEEYVELIMRNSEISICFDSQGPQVRTGMMHDGTIELRYGRILELVSSNEVSDIRQIPLYPFQVISILEIGDLISLDFDTVLLQVIQKDPTCRARVIVGGMVGSNKAVSIIDSTIPLPCLTDVDRSAFKLGVRLGIQYAALSFTNQSSDIQELREIVREEVTIIAKIESRVGLQRIDEIVGVADAILIDRGDLSREIALESIPYIQKEIICRANENEVPVYVATNLLESMTEKVMPTRAEVNDVINTLNDGADGLVLAAETAIGKHPVSCAGMVKALIHRFENPVDFLSRDHWYSQSILVQPHGGRLMENIIDEPSEYLEKFPLWKVDHKTIIDAEQLALGVFSPLSGFLSRDDLDSVLEHSRLCDGNIWTMPILLQIQRKCVFPYGKGDLIVIGFRKKKRLLLKIDSTYRYDLQKLAKGCYGTSSPVHPEVKRLLKGSDLFVSGQVSLLRSDLRKRKPFELTPAQSRMVFQHNNWSRVVGFHSRNVPHRAHQYLQMTAMEKYDCDGLFIHPVIGPKRPGDFKGDIIVHVYHELIEKEYPPSKVVLGGFSSYSRYAGPREAVFTALCRKNFGCSHFIVGRDHTGVGSLYSKDDAKRLFDDLGDTGIFPIFFDEVYYCKKCRKYKENCEHGIDSIVKISGTEAREKLVCGISLPEWYMSKSVSQFIIDEINKGKSVFC